MASLFAPKEPHRAIVAAAHKVDLDDPHDSQKNLGRIEQWQQDVFDLFDEVGQLKHAAWLIGDVLSNVNIYVGEVQADPKDRPVPTEDERAKAPLERLQNNSEGLPTLLREHAMHGTTAGECNLVGLNGERRPDGRERWFIASVKEVQGGTPTRVRNPDDPIEWIDLKSPKKAEEEGTEPDYIVRMWQRHLVDGFHADSPYRGLITDAKEYVLFGKTVRNVARTRMTSAGFLKVPDELSFAPIEGMDEDMHPFMQRLVQATLASMRTETNANSAIPMVVSGPAEYLEQFQHVLVDRPLDRLWMELREKSLEHLAQGMPMPPEFTFGLGRANHWSAGSIEDGAFRQYFEPLLVWICNCWTRAFLWPFLEADGITNPRAYVVWFDASHLTTNAERAKNAGEAHDRKVISDATYRESLGFSDDDAPTEAAPATSPEEPPEPPQAPATSLPVQASAESDIGAQLVELDRGLQERLEGAADLALERALERAGNVLKTRAQKDKTLTASLNGVKPKAIAATIGRAQSVRLASVDDLLSEAWIELGDRFERWVASAQGAALNLVPNLESLERREAEAEQARARSSAWRWLEDQLSQRAIEVLYSPSQNGSLTQTIREALGRAGG